MAARWLARQSWTDGHRRTVQQRLDLNLLPWLGTRPVREITAPDVLVPLRLVEDRGAQETAHSCRTIVGQVVAFAVAEGLVTSNPARDLAPALVKAVDSGYVAAYDYADWWVSTVRDSEDERLEREDDEAIEERYRQQQRAEQRQQRRRRDRAEEQNRQRVLEWEAEQQRQFNAL